MHKPLLLDTHIWIWLLEGHARVKSPSFLKLVNKAVRASQARISVISVWEIATLVRKGRIEISGPCQEWVKEALDRSGVLLSELTIPIAVDSALLPQDLIPDPADRIIAVTAKNLAATLVTADKQLLKFAKASSIPTVTP